MKNMPTRMHGTFGTKGEAQTRMLREQPKFAQRTFKCIPTKTGKFSVVSYAKGYKPKQ